MFTTLEALLSESYRRGLKYLLPKQRVAGSSPVSRSRSIKSRVSAIQFRRKAPKEQMLTQQPVSRLP